jgi:hypothetical protein
MAEICADASGAYLRLRFYRNVLDMLPVSERLFNGGRQWLRLETDRFTEGSGGQRRVSEGPLLGE